MNNKVFVGFDGYVDRVVRVVKQCVPGSVPSFFPTIDSFGNRIKQAAGLSSEFELLRQEERLGGNAPIMAKALAALGAQVTLAAAVDHPLFDQLKEQTTVYSLGAPAECTAMEFDDGKLLMADNTSLNALDYKALTSIISEDIMKEAIRDASVVAMVNYCGLLHAYDLWKGFLEHIATSGKMWYFDISDPSKFPPEYLIQCLKLLQAFRDFGEVVLGVNQNEVTCLMNALSIQTPLEIVNLGFVDTLLVHPREGVYVIDQTGSSFVQGSLVEHPVVSTGGGDHFNAGYCFGRMQGMSKTEAAALGTLVSGRFVASGKSPAYQECR